MFKCVSFVLKEELGFRIVTKSPFFALKLKVDNNKINTQNNVHKRYASCKF
jgi:hypothetical protein